LEETIMNDPCGNKDCDKCYPIPRFIVSTERVSRRRHARTIKAATPEEARRLYDEGTAWPSSYDDDELAVLERGDTIVTAAESRDDLDIESVCYHNLPSATAAGLDVEADPVDAAGLDIEADPVDAAGPTAEATDPIDVVREAALDLRRALQEAIGVAKRLDEQQHFAGRIGGWHDLALRAEKVLQVDG
jgi:hypothetical protein